MLVTWRLVYAFISQEEQAKEEKTRQQSWEISGVPPSGCAGFYGNFYYILYVGWAIQLNS